MPIDASLLFEPLDVTELVLDADWWAIYEGAFPSGEREPRAVILDSIARNVGVAVRARRDGTTVGLATAHILRTPPAVFLVYVAMAEGSRRGGGGRALVEHAWQLGAARLKAEGADAIGMIWEVDDPDAGSDAERVRRQNRVMFFRKLGGELLPRYYLQPPVDGVAPVPMRLMYRPAAGSTLPDEPAIEGLVHAIYFEKYKAVNRIPADTLGRLLRADDGRPSTSA